MGVGENALYLCTPPPPSPTVLGNFLVCLVGNTARQTVVKTLNLSGSGLSFYSRFNPMNIEANKAMRVSYKLNIYKYTTTNFSTSNISLISSKAN